MYEKNVFWANQSDGNKQISLTPLNSLGVYFRGNSQKGDFAQNNTWLDLFSGEVTTANIGKKAFYPGILL